MTKPFTPLPSPFELNPFDARRRERSRARTAAEAAADRDKIEALYGMDGDGSQPEFYDEWLADSTTPGSQFNTATVNINNIYSQIGEDAQYIQDEDEPNGTSRTEIAQLSQALHSTHPAAGKFAHQLQTSQAGMQREFNRLGLTVTPQNSERLRTRATSQVLSAGIEDDRTGSSNINDETPGGDILDTHESRQLTRAATAEQFLLDVRAGEVDVSQLNSEVRERIYSYMGFFAEIEQQTNVALAELGALLENLPAIPRVEESVADTAADVTTDTTTDTTDIAPALGELTSTQPAEQPGYGAGLTPVEHGLVLPVDAFGAHNAARAAEFAAAPAERVAPLQGHAGSGLPPAARVA